MSRLHQGVDISETQKLMGGFEAGLAVACATSYVGPAHVRLSESMSSFRAFSGYANCFTLTFTVKFSGAALTSLEDE